MHDTIAFLWHVLLVHASKNDVNANQITTTKSDSDHLDAVKQNSHMEFICVHWSQG